MRARSRLLAAKTAGEKVYLEAFGFWSRAAVWRRIELLQKGFPARVILAVNSQLRVSEEVLGEDDAGESLRLQNEPSRPAPSSSAWRPGEARAEGNPPAH